MPGRGRTREEIRRCVRSSIGTAEVKLSSVLITSRESIQLGLHAALVRAVHEDDRGKPLAEGKDGVVAALRPLLEDRERLHDRAHLGEDRFQVSAAAARGSHPVRKERAQARWRSSMARRIASASASLPSPTSRAIS